MLSHTSNGYSVQVRMTLLVGDQSVRVGQMGPNFLVLAEPFSTQVRQGIVRLVVDEVTEDIPVLLPQGIPSGTDWVETAEVEAEALVAA